MITINELPSINVGKDVELPGSSVIDELRGVWTYQDEAISPGLRLYGVLFILGLLIIVGGVLGVSMYVDGVTTVASPSDPVVSSSYEWEIPVQSPEIGVRPDGSVGNINPYGRVSAV